MKKPPTFAQTIATLDPEKVRIIRRGAAQNIPAGEFSRAYGVSIETVRRVIRRETWAWVTEEGDIEAPMRIPGPELTEEQIKASQERLKKLLEGPDKS